VSVGAIGHAAALIVGITLLAAAATKLRSLAVFREEIADYQILPYRVTRAVAVFVVSIEAVAGVLILLPATRRMGAIVAGRATADDDGCRSEGLVSRSADSLWLLRRLR
jgi:hypothetical protein